MNPRLVTPLDDVGALIHHLHAQNVTCPITTLFQEWEGGLILVHIEHHPAVANKQEWSDRVIAFFHPEAFRPMIPQLVRWQGGDRIPPKWEIRQVPVYVQQRIREHGWRSSFSRNVPRQIPANAHIHAVPESEFPNGLLAPPRLPPLIPLGAVIQLVSPLPLAAGA